MIDSTMGLTIAQLLPELQSGGVERGTLEIAAEAVRQGHRALVISAGGRLVEELNTLGGDTSIGRLVKNR